MTKLSKFNHLTDKQLLEHYAELMKTMKDRNVVRSNNNPVSDYAEKLACDKLGLVLCSKSTKGYDATKGNKKYQIKGRRITADNKSRQLGVIRNLDDNLFDYLVVVIFDEAFNVQEAYQVSHSVAHKIATKKSKNALQNGHIMHANPEFISKSKDITLLFK